MNHNPFFSLLTALVMGTTLLPAAENDQPKVLLLGDSISIGYTPLVIEGMKGKAVVSRPKANCGNTQAGLANFDKWIAGGPWDVIHFNWGLHDLCYRNPESKEQGHRDKVKGALSVPLPEYEKNLETLVERLKATGATLVFATTTVVPDGEAGRIVGDDAKYNSVAERVMKKHGVLINDLHATTKAFGPELFVGPGNVHYTKEGSTKLAAQVMASIESALKQKALK
jgi:hypothetical protein